MNAVSANARDGVRASVGAEERGRRGDGVPREPKTVEPVTNAGTRSFRLIRRHTELDVYQRAFESAMRLHELSRSFPTEEKYSLTDQMRRAARSVCANTAEAWRKRRYRAAFVSKLSDAEGEAAEAQVWIQFAVECGYVDRESGRALYSVYDEILGMLVKMIHNPDPWLLK
jgi:four helix bundle protein